MNKAVTSCEITRRVPFYDLDPIQVVWHGNYFNYFEDARVALFARNGIDLFDVYKKTSIIFPIIKTSTKHISPLRYNDEFICKATMIDARFKLVVDFELRLAAGGMVCTRGRTEQVAVRAPEMEILFSIPEEIRNACGF
jgi:acyl-CoA thioester hydrolase